LPGEVKSTEQLNYTGLNLYIFLYRLGFY